MSITTPHAVLMHSWPESLHRDRFCSAKRTCIAALCGRQTPQYARPMFVEACEEAQVPYREGNLPV